MTSFDVMDGTVLGFGPTQSGLTIRAGRDPRAPAQRPPPTLPPVRKQPALPVPPEYGEHSEKIGHTQIKQPSAGISFQGLRARASAICWAIWPILASSWLAFASRRAAARLLSLRFQLKAF